MTKKQFIVDVRTKADMKPLNESEMNKALRKANKKWMERAESYLEKEGYTEKAYAFVSNLISTIIL